MELLRKSRTMVTAGGGSADMAEEKVTLQSNIQMEVSTIISTRIMSATVTEFKQIMEKYIEESSKVATMTVMDSSSIKITMSMTVN